MSQLNSYSKMPLTKDLISLGSVEQQCDFDGKCTCKPGVTGDKCDQCEVNHWNKNSAGCESCGCLEQGSQDNTKSCSQETGECDCKQNVIGKRCDQCKLGHFHIDEENEFGCTPCFCYAHTSKCELIDGFFKCK